MSGRRAVIVALLSVALHVRVEAAAHAGVTYRRAEKPLRSRVLKRAALSSSGLFRRFDTRVILPERRDRLVFTLQPGETLARWDGYRETVEPAAVATEGGRSRAILSPGDYVVNRGAPDARYFSVEAGVARRPPPRPPTRAERYAITPIEFSPKGRGPALDRYAAAVNDLFARLARRGPQISVMASNGLQETARAVHELEYLVHLDALERRIERRGNVLEVRYLEKPDDGSRRRLRAVVRLERGRGMDGLTVEGPNDPNTPRRLTWTRNGGANLLDLEGQRDHTREVQIGTSTTGEWSSREAGRQAYVVGANGQPTEIHELGPDQAVAP